MRRFILWLLRYPERRAGIPTGEHVRPMSHAPTGRTGAAEESANYVPSWAKPIK